MQLVDQFVKTISDQNLFGRNDRLLVAVSGGIDSIVLVELCARAGFNFEMAHANFKLRGSESDEDELFVEQLSRKYGVRLHSRNLDAQFFSQTQSCSIQVAARTLRYEWFNELLTEGFQFLLTAHHEDDNIETVLMNFFRGTGISGLRGMLPKRGNIVRPMLHMKKDELLSFAKENHLSWRDDSSNATDKYSRNYFRLNIIPAIEKVFPEAGENVAANISRIRDAEILYYQAVHQHKKNLLEERKSEIHIPVLKLKKVQPLATIVYEIVKIYGFTSHQTPQIVGLLNAEQGSYIASPSHRIIRNRNWLIIAPVDSPQTETIVVEKAQRTAQFAQGTLHFEMSEVINIDADTRMAQMDADEIEYPLIIRKWKKGDYFYPLGMVRKKKIARFLIDQKLSPVQKQNVHVLQSGKKICWVIGMRIDDRFKIRKNTKRMLKVSLKP